MALSPGFDFGKLKGIDFVELQRRIDERDAQQTAVTAAAESPEDLVSPQEAGEPQNSLPTEDILEFDRRRAAARAGFARGTANLGLARSRAETDFGRAQDGTSIGGGLFGRTRDFFKQQRQDLSGAFVGRGVVNSGIFKNALNRHFTERTNALDDLEIQFSRTFQDFDFTEENLAQSLEDALANIEGDQQLRRSVFAQMIRNGGTA